MISNRTLGLIFPSAKKGVLSEFTLNRNMGSVPLGGRYRLIDFALSAMSNAGIQKVGVILKENYSSLIAHIGSGREWDLSRKLDGITMFPPYSDGVKLYNGRIESLHSIIDYIKNSKEELVIMTNSCNACSLDYNEVINFHLNTNADVTAVYKKVSKKLATNISEVSYKVDTQDNIKQILIDDNEMGEKNISMSIYVVKKDLLVDMVEKAYSSGCKSFERDVLRHNENQLKVVGYNYTGYCPSITTLKEYYDANIALIKPENLKAVFQKKNPIYTRVRDDAPTIHTISSNVKNSIIADGCIISGKVENCVLSRGVIVKKGAILKNCVISRDNIIEENVVLENVITDKKVTFGKNKTVQGTENYPVFISANATV